MRKGITAALVGAALCIPSVGFASHDDFEANFTDTTYETEDECEEAIADERKRTGHDRGLRGRALGEHNKTFNAQYDCAAVADPEDEDDEDFVVDDTTTTEDDPE